MAVPAPSAQRMFLVSVSGTTGYWQTKSGGERSSDTTRNFDGGSLVPQIIAGPADTANITVSRAWNSSIDSSLQKALRLKVGRSRHTVTVQPTDEDLGVVPGTATVYTNALLVRVSEPDVDAGSGDVAMWELEFAVSAIA